MLPAISSCQRTSLGVVILNKVLITGDVECPPPASTCRSISLKYAIWLIYDGLLIKLKVNILWTCFLASSTQNKSLEFSTFSNLTLKSIFRIKTLLNFTKSSWSSQLHRHLITKYSLKSLPLSPLSSIFSGESGSCPKSSVSEKYNSNYFIFLSYLKSAKLKIFMLTSRNLDNGFFMF